MARATIELVHALRKTAQRLEQGSRYRWSHFGQCNCGHLAQTVTRLSSEQLQRMAYERGGDWGELSREYCPTTGLPLDHVFSQLFALGMTPDDVQRLERLSDTAVLREFSRDELLHHNRRTDVVRYMRAWADVLERKLPATVSSEVCEFPVAAE